MVGYISGYWFDIFCDCKYFDWEDLNMAKKNKTVAEDILGAALKLESGFNPLEHLDYSKYPDIKKFVDDYNKAHPHLAFEVMNDTDKFMDELQKAELQMIDNLLSRTNQFKEYYEVASMHWGIITYFMTLCTMLSVKLENLQEKLDRYENND